MRREGEVVKMIQWETIRSQREFELK